MSDLISRSELIKTLEQYKENDWNKKLCTMLPNVVDDCIDFIENMPTAYDIDKVVDELEKREEHYVEMLDWQGQMAIVDAIEIVKRGCVSDDVCEFGIFDNSLTDVPQWVYKTTCGKYIGEEHTSKAFVYCPYCGKKIKVVE